MKRLIASLLLTVWMALPGWCALVNHYPLDETTGTNIDDPVGANDGTASKTVTSEAGPAAHVPAAITFDDSLQITFTAIALNGNFSIAFWAKNTAATTELPTAVGLTSSANQRIEWVPESTADDNMIVRITAATPGGVALGVDDNQWHHYVVIRTGGDIALWVDAAVVNADIFGETDKSGNTSWDAIGVGNSAAHKMIGALADVRFYSHALSQAEIDALYSPAAVAVTVQLLEQGR